MENQRQEFDPTTTSVFSLNTVDEAVDAPLPLSARDQDAVNAGRSPRADIFLDDVTVSRKHCQFLSRDGGHTVRDSGSLNGTYVNRERVDQCELHAGDEVQIGKYRLTYQPSPQVQ